MIWTRCQRTKKAGDHIGHADKDLGIKDATPWEVAQKLMQGGVPRRSQSIGVAAMSE